MTKRSIDPVASGAAALRRLTADDSDAADVTRGRLMARMDRRGPTAWLSKRMLLAVVLLLVASSALAATIATVMRQDHHPAPHASAPTTEGLASHHRAPVPPTRSATAEVDPPVALLPTAAPPTAIPPTAIPPIAARRSQPVHVASVHRPAPSTPVDADAELTAYGAAHQAHFADHDFARALPLWDRYLSRFPRGRLVPEATYNRAIALVRLKRTADAIVALGPLAAGRFDGYRQPEAQALLEALRPE